MLRRNQKGFAVVELLLIAVGILIIAGTGWYVIKAKNDTDKILSAAEASSNIKSNGKKKSTTGSSASSSSSNQNSPRPAPSPSGSSAHKSSSGPCGGTQATITNGNVICSFSVGDSQVPAEVRMLAPSGSPGIKVECDTGEACTDSQYGQPVTYYTAKIYQGQFGFNVVKASKVTISAPVTRTREGSVNGHLGIFTDTSSYWLYGSSHGVVCCGVNFIYDIYNGYTETFKPY